MKLMIEEGRKKMEMEKGTVAIKGNTKKREIWEKERGERSKGLSAVNLQTEDRKGYRGGWEDEEVVWAE